MDTTPLLGRIRAYAKSKDLDVTWTDIRKRFSEDFEDLSSYHQRQLSVQFATWITRERQDPEGSLTAA